MIRAILVDDEQLALKYLHIKLETIGGVEVIATFSNGSDFLKEMKTLSFDVAFLDIEMPGLNGLDLAEILHSWNPSVLTVFVTAYRDYAIDAFNLHSVDYLLKPFTADRLAKTVQRLRGYIGENPRNDDPPSPVSLKFTCFTEFALYINDEQGKWKTAKVKELCAFLITHAGTPMHRDSIINAIWPDTDYPRAKIQLHTAVSYLRKTLQSVGFEGAVSFSNDCYVLNLPSIKCDAHEFSHFMNTYKGVNNENCTKCEEIAALYTGDYLENNGYCWSVKVAQLMRQQMVGLLHGLINFFSEAGDGLKKHMYLQLLATVDSYSEFAVRELMEHYIASGNRAEAVKVYHDMKKRLAHDFGIAPDPAVTELLKSIL